MSTVTPILRLLCRVFRDWGLRLPFGLHICTGVTAQVRRGAGPGPLRGSTGLCRCTFPFLTPAGPLAALPAPRALLPLPVTAAPGLQGRRPPGPVPPGGHAHGQRGAYVPQGQAPSRGPGAEEGHQAPRSGLLHLQGTGPRQWRPKTRKTLIRRKFH